jgi:hypothetical protein
MTPPSRTRGRGLSTQHFFFGALTNIFRQTPKRSLALIVLMGVSVVTLNFAIHSFEHTGYRLPSLFLPMLLPLLGNLAPAGMSDLLSLVHGGFHVSFKLPTTRRIEEWVRISAKPDQHQPPPPEVSNQSDPPVRERILLGRGAACHRCARDFVENLRFCALNECGEVK